jgi:thiol-disulfide isomerase/thioredoxin
MRSDALRLILAVVLGACSAPPRAEREASVPQGRPMLLDFTRDYCLACQVMAPAITELRREHAGQVEVIEVNLDREKNERLGLYFVIDTVPAQVFIDASGKIAARHGGMATGDEMRATIRGLGWVR